MSREKNKTPATNQQVWLTQKQLATRWHVSPGTIINLRKQGQLPFFRLPGSSKILYPMDRIIALEQQNTTTTEEAQRQKRHVEYQGKKPAMSAKPIREWRI